MAMVEHTLTLPLELATKSTCDSYKNETLTVGHTVILVLCSNPRERLCLSLHDTLLAVLLRCKDTIIAMKVLNFSIGSIINPLLETLLAHNGVW